MTIVEIKSYFYPPYIISKAEELLGLVKEHSSVKDVLSISTFGGKPCGFQS